MSGDSGASPIALAREVHRSFQLAGEPRNALPALPDDQLGYVMSLLRDEAPVPLVISPDEWQKLLDMLDLHMILPVLYRKAYALPPGSKLPEAVLARLKSSYLSVSANAMLRERQIGGLLEALKEEGIRAILLKGPALAWSVYPSPAMRLYMDIDLLVKLEDAIKARNVLTKLGYRCLERRADVSPEGFIEEVFIPETSPDAFRIEVHWGLHWYSRMNRAMEVEGIMARAVTVKNGSLEYEMLDYVDALIHASTHLIYQHIGGIRLNWIYDIALLAERLDDSQWKSLPSRSRDYGARLALEESLKMAIAWCGLKIPPEHGDFSRWTAPQEWEVVAFSYALEGTTGSIFNLMFPAFASPAEKAALLFRLFFPAPGIMQYFHPDSRGWRLPIGYVKRWLKLLRRL